MKHGQHRRRRILLIGWDAADWKVINPLLDAGEMPFLRSVIERGVMGNLRTQHPVLSPMLWTSIATGKRPWKHGILGFAEPAPDLRSVRPVSSLSRRTKALWNILGQQGLRSNVIGWWPTHPVEPINGIMVSNHYQHATGPIGQPWPLPPGSVHPPELARQFAGIRLHPNEVDAEQLLAFVPGAAAVDQDSDHRIASIVKILAENTSVHMAASHAMQANDWDLTAVYYDAIDHFCHGFMKYHPPRRAHIPAADYELYRDVVKTAYRYQDLMLGGLLRQAGEEATVIIVSDHGFHPDHNRPLAIPHQPAGPAIEHRDYGIVVMAGPGIRRDDIVHGASQLDITPTILALLGLPVGADMDGRPLTQVFIDAPRIETIPSWDDVPGDAGLHPAGRRTDPVAAREALDQLVALGYIEDGDGERAAAGCADELKFNLAMSHMDGDRHADAVPLLDELYTRRPDEHRFGLQLALCYRALGRLDALEELVERIHARREAEAREAAAELQRLQSVHGHDAPPSTQAQRTAPDEPDTATRKQWLALRRRATLSSFDTEYLRGYVAAARGEPARALHHLREAARAQPARPGLHLQIGDAHVSLRQWPEAEASYRQALAIDPDNAYAELGLARVFHCRRRPRPAVQHALRAIGLEYHFPVAHFILGRALAQLRHHDAAARALRVALAQNPNFREAHLRLALLYERRLGAPELGRRHRTLAKALAAEAHERHTAQDAGGPLATRPHLARKPATASGTAPVITVVTGLPRSGTSMMMQMLAAGGMDILSDGVRGADTDNPRGYFELQDATRLHRDTGWLDRASGRAVKIVAQLLPHLPDGFRYRVIFMQRDIEEVLASQHRMRERLHGDGDAPDAERLRHTFTRQLETIRTWLDGQDHTAVLYVDYHGVLEDPGRTAENVAGFLEQRLALGAMSRAVDPTLYRQRKRTPRRGYLDRHDLAHPADG